jgi:hypothetical protein
MKKFLFAVLTLLALASLSFGQIVNDGIRTRTMYKEFTLSAGQSDCTGVVFPLYSISEQGFAFMALMIDTTDTFDVWYQTGGRLIYFGVDDTVWSDPVQCVFDEVITDREGFGPLNISFIQSEALVDTSDRKTGYMGLDYLRVLIDPSADDDTLETYLEHNGIAKVWFK